MDANLDAPYSTSKSIASTGHTFTQRPHAAQASGRATVKSDLGLMKLPGHASTQELQPIHASASKVKDFITLERFAGCAFSAMKIAFQGQDWEQTPHWIHFSSSTTIGSP